MDASRTHQPTQDALAATLRPRSIAVVGASPRSFAGQIVQRNCADHRFGGLIVPVNGRYAEVAGVLARRGRRHRHRLSRTVEFEARKIIASRYDLGPSAADVLKEPVVVCRATGTTVIPKEHSRKQPDA